MSIEMEPNLPLNSEEEENTNHKVTFLNLCGTFIGLLFYLFDICSDIILARSYFHSRYYGFGACTIFVTYLATVADTVSSISRKEFKNKRPWFWFQYITLSLVNLWGVKIIFSLIVSQYKAYKSQRVTADMNKIIEEKNIRVAWLKIYECTFETLPQICLQMYIIYHMRELPSFKLPFVSERGELQTTIDSFQIPLALLHIKIAYFIITTVVNRIIIQRIEVSTMALITMFGSIIFTSMVRLASVVLILITYPYHATAVILLHISVGCIYWYYNFSNENQSVHMRWLNSILVATLWFLLPFIKTKRKRILFTLNIIHFIGNVAATTTTLITIEMYTYTSAFILVYCTLYIPGLVCWIVYYFCYLKEIDHQLNQRSLSEEETENSL